MTTTITEFIQSIKERLAKAKAWLGFKRPEGMTKGRCRAFYRLNHYNNKFFALIVALKIGLVIGISAILGGLLIPYFDKWHEMIGAIMRVLMIGVLGWLFYRTLRAVFQYKPISRDRLMVGRSRRDRLGWGMGMYALIASAMIFFYIFALALVLVQGPSSDIFNGSTENKGNIFWDVLSQFADPGNLPNAHGFWGRSVAFLSAFVGILCLSGFAITSLVSMITRRSKDWQRGLLRYERDFKDYVVIIGFNEQTATIVMKSLKRVQYVLVQTRRSVEEQRAKLELKLDRADEERVVFYFGERTVYEDICDLRLENAREVYILGEDMESENEPDHDSYNMKCLELISQYCEELSKNKSNVNTSWWGKKLKCHVELEYQSTYTIFKATHIYKLLNQNVEFIPFNVYEIWAKKVLVDNYAILPGKKNDEHQVQRYLPIDSYRDSKTHEIKGITFDCDKSVHLIIVGMNQMGIALAMQAALSVHLPNFHTNKKRRTTISFISEHATRESEFLMGHYETLFALCRHRTIHANRLSSIKTWEEENLSNVDPMASANGRYSHLGENFMDIQWEFIEGSIASPCVRDYLIRETGDSQQTCTIAVCNNEPQKSIATALYLPELVQKRVHQVLVYQRNSFDLVNKVATGEKQWKRYEKLKPFGMIADCYKGNMFDAVMPKLVLALYRDSIHDITTSNPKIDAYIDHINDMWSEEGIVYKLSNINVTDCFKSKLRSVGLTEFSSVKDRESVIDNAELMDALVATEHQRWVTERLTMGYRPLDANEISYFEALAKEKPGQSLSIEGKAKKEYYKDKSRAHLDICSCEMLDQIDPGTKVNDRRIIENLINLTFYTTVSKIVSRLALMDEEQGHEKDENLKLAKLFLDEMVVVKGQSTLDVKTIDEVPIPQMWVGKYPVTQEMWKIIMGQDMNHSMCAGHDTERHPVNMVSKEDIDDFLLILNDLTGLRFSLPTKQEWLYAALGGVRAIKKRKTINDLAWNIDSCARERKRQNSNQGAKPKTHQVGLRKKNGYGLYDMLGNVWEWTRTMSEASTYCFCGGSWRFGPQECELSETSNSWYNSWTPEHKSDDLGFRLVLYHDFPKNYGNKAVLMHERDKMVRNIAQHMRSVKSGAFWMGTDCKEMYDGTPEEKHADTLPDERPAHQVKQSAFMISDILVTQRQYKAIMEEDPSEQKGDYLPVENVSYQDVRTFINKLNKACCSLLPDDIVPPDGKIFDLPTQAQWEFAARDGNGDASTYTIYSGNDNPDVVAWHFGITKGTHVVAKKSSNHLKLYDMCGNVWEWCSDWYQSDYYEECRRMGIVEDPKGPESGITHVLRGGSWRFTAGECRLTRVAHWPEDYKANDVGFRLVANVDESVIKKLKDLKI